MNSPGPPGQKAKENALVRAFSFAFSPGGRLCRTGRVLNNIPKFYSSIEIFLPDLSYWQYFTPAASNIFLLAIVPSVAAYLSLS